MSVDCRVDEFECDDKRCGLGKHCGNREYAKYNERAAPGYIDKVDIACLCAL